MSPSHFTDQELLAYIDELLPVERTATVEKALRDSASLRQHVALLARRRDQGGHTVGEIWRRLRLSCPTRSQWLSYLEGTLGAGMSNYFEFHLHVIGCRYCAANLRDLQASPDAPDAQRRRGKFFQSSAGYLADRV